MSDSEIFEERRLRRNREAEEEWREHSLAFRASVRCLIVANKAFRSAENFVAAKMKKTKGKS